MKPKGLLIAVALLAVSAELVWWSNKKPGRRRRQAATTTDQAAHDPRRPVPGDPYQEGDRRSDRCSRSEDGKWKITEPKQLPADQDAVASLVSTLASLNCRQVVEEKAADLTRTASSDPTLDVQVKRKDGKTDSC